MPELEQPGTFEQQPPMGLEPSASETMQQVASEVLETMFFTEPEPATCEHGWLRAASCARIHFEGSYSGEMQMALSAEASDPIAASFLGVEPMELTDAQRGQVIQELTNIMCGAMLSRLWPESRLALASPELTVWQEWAEEGALHRCFIIPEGMLSISVRLLATDGRPAAE